MPTSPVRPVWNRIIFGLALLGVLVAVHLHFQVENGFARGCLGLGALDPAAPVGCSEVTESEYGSILGIKNAILGLIFYLALALVRLVRPLAEPPRAELLRKLSFVIAGIGLSFSLYFVYVQAVLIGEFCVLCTTSAVLVAILFGLHVLEQRALQGRTSSPPPPRPAALREVGALGLGLLACGLLIGADAAYTQRAFADDTPVEVADTATPPATDGGEATPVSDGPVAPGVGLAGCEFDASASPLGDTALYTDGFPALGNADSPVTVIEFFDPNCPACRELHGVLKQTIETHGERAAFYYYPYPIRGESLLQVQALYLARDQGKYLEMVDAQFALQRGWGVSREQMAAMAQLAGLDGEATVQALEADEAGRAALIQQIQQTEQRLSLASVPRLAINGRFVPNTLQAFTPACLGALIDQEYERLTGEPAEEAEAPESGGGA